MYYEANCTSVYMSIEYTHFEVQQVIPRSEWCVCGATSLTWRGEGSCSLARSCLDPDGGGGYLLNMPNRPVWQPSHYIRPVISLKLLHSKWLSRVRVICLSTGELEGGGRDLDPLLFVSQLNLRLLMMILRENKGKIFSSRENYFSNIGITTTSFLTKGSSPFRIFGKSREFVLTGRTYGVSEHPKLKEIYLFCILRHV